MKITWQSAAALELKGLIIKSKVKYTIRSEIVKSQEILEQATKYHIT
jgi:hypothetical protein